MPSNESISDVVREELYNFLSNNTGLEAQKIKSFMLDKQKVLSSVEFLCIARGIGLSFDDIEQKAIILDKAS